MADSKLTALTADGTPVGADLLYIVDDVAGTATSKKITLTNLAAGVGNLIGAYTSYTPTFAQSGALTTSALTARYNQIGKRVHAWGKATFNNAGTTNNPITMTLPVTMSASITAIDYTFGTGAVADAGTIWMPALVVFATGTTVGFTKTNGDVQAFIGQTPNFAIASGDFISWNITYEAA